jgi:hypothetical protein
MYRALTEELVDFKNIVTDVRRGLTHTEIRIMADSVKMRRPGFVVDIYVHRRTQEFSVARIDNKDEKMLHKVKEIVSRFEF